MHEYDISLKLLLRSSGGGILRALTGGVEVTNWLNVEISQMRNTRVDLLGETADGDLIHIELQSTNDPEMAVRMMDYFVQVYRQFRRFPRQILLYVGDADMRMGTELAAPNVSFRYDAVDIRDLDGDKLLESAEIAGLEPAQRDLAFHYGSSGDRT
jgi:hypothetical protein